jgi:hypothetical protein
MLSPRGGLGRVVGLGFNIHVYMKIILIIIMIIITTTMIRII